jgi:hypothetical protein
VEALLIPSYTHRFSIYLPLSGSGSGKALNLRVVVAARPPLAPLALIFPAIPQVLWRHRVVGLAIVIVGTAGWMAASAATYIHPRTGMDFTINPDDFGTVKQLHYIVIHPLRFCFTFVNTLHEFAPCFYKAFIGVLGWYDVFVPRWYILVASINIVLAFAASISKRDRPWSPAAVAAGAAIIGCVITVLIAQYLAWTPVGLDIILGVQGRYFVAPALFAVMLCPSLTLPRALRSTLTATTVGLPPS